MKIAFVEKKKPDFGRIADLLARCEQQNRWANRGPMYQLYRKQLEGFLNLPAGCGVVPVANGGVALEAMARLHAKQAGRPLRWVASAYSFQNLGRGYFADVQFCDCDDGGLLDLKAVAELPADSYDGIIITNPFGLYCDFSAYAKFAEKTGKSLLLDNAAGLFSDIPQLKWQAFSLHHTKPYGMGEGGLALVPKDLEEELYALLNYGEDLADSDRTHWLQNGKISDLNCAFLIDRLEQSSEWCERSLHQRDRVIAISKGLGLTPLSKPETRIPMTSVPFLSEAPIPQSAIGLARHATFLKYYHPLAEFPRVNDIYGRLVNIPCHGDMGRLTDVEIKDDINRCMGQQLPVQRSLANSVEKFSSLLRSAVRP